MSQQAASLRSSMQTQCLTGFPVGLFFVLLPDLGEIDYKSNQSPIFSANQTPAQAKASVIVLGTFQSHVNSQSIAKPILTMNNAGAMHISRMAIRSRNFIKNLPRKKRKVAQLPQFRGSRGQL